MSKRNNNLMKGIIVTFFTLVFILSVSFVSAATISFSPSSGNYKVGDTIQANVIVSSNTSINAVSSKISFPSDILSLSSISKSGSIISLWAQEPSYSNANGTASIEGVILSGYSGAFGKVITLFFKAKSEGQAQIKFNGASILANDGNGTEVITGNTPSIITVAKAIEIPQEKPKEKVKTPVSGSSPVVEKIIEKSEEAVVKVREVEKNNNLPNYSLVITLLLIIIIMYGIYYTRKLWENFKNKISKTSNNVLDDLDVLKMDLDNEVIIVDKIRRNEPLNSSEVSFQTKLGKDINNTEEKIKEEIKELKVKE